MEEVTWVEVLSRHREVAARLRFTGAEIRIGRAYDNDVVLDDPYVAPRHLLIRRDPSGALVAEDLGSANGLYADRGRTRLPRIVLDGERPIRIGHTLLRVRAASQPVAPERIEADQRRRWPLPVALGATVLGIEALSLWLGQVAEPRAARYMEPLLALAVAATGWSTIWALIARIFSTQAHFERHLTIALSGLLVYSLYDEVADFATYSFVSPYLSLYKYVGMWAVVGAVCFFHLREINPTRLRLKAGATIALAAGAIAFQTLSQSEFGGGDRLVYSRHLMPPELRLTPVETEDDFFSAVEQLKGKLEADRKEELP
ncbi:MAG TPA: FHA domain-containing protein [Stellaceae bacterium]|nr:FHA domain-containing protein [Stellaceae bacterium]